MSRSTIGRWLRGQQPLRSSAFIAICLLALPLAACGANSPGGTGVVVPTQTSNNAAFEVSSVDLAVNPAAMSGMTCGSAANFTYSATFHIPAGAPGGTILFTYTLNNGRSEIPSAVTVAPGETQKTFTFITSGALPSDHTYPGVAIVRVTSPNSISSPAATPNGVCSAPGNFEVREVTMTVDPASISGMQCYTSLTVTYTATFLLPPDSPGGTIQFEYTVNNGRGSRNATIDVSAGQTSASYVFQWKGALPADHTYPAPGGVIVNSPNVITSPRLGPGGACS